jgi:hypothetical protein
MYTHDVYIYDINIHYDPFMLGNPPFQQKHRLRLGILQPLQATTGWLDSTGDYQGREKKVPWLAGFRHGKMVIS